MEVWTTGYFQLCTCPPVWHGIIPPSCPMHYPEYRASTKTVSSTTTTEFLVTDVSSTDYVFRAGDCLTTYTSQ